MTFLYTPICETCEHPLTEHEDRQCEECRIYGGACDQRPPEMRKPEDEPEDAA